VVQLPNYFEDLTEAEGRAIFLTVELHTAIEGKPSVGLASPSEIQGGYFHIQAPVPNGTKVHWLVKAKRKNTAFDVAPLKSEVTLGGSGPYQYVEAP